MVGVCRLLLKADEWYRWCGVSMGLPSNYVVFGVFVGCIVAVGGVCCESDGGEYNGVGLWCVVRFFIFFVAGCWFFWGAVFCFCFCLIIWVVGYVFFDVVFLLLFGFFVLVVLMVYGVFLSSISGMRCRVSVVCYGYFQELRWLIVR